MASILSIPGSRTVESARLLHLWRDGLHTIVADKLPEEVQSRKGTYVSWTLILCCSFTLVRRPTHPNQLATFSADLESQVVGSGQPLDPSPL